jgi:hypothetical protein
MGWDTAMNALKEITSLTSLNGVDGFCRFFAGPHEEIDLASKNLAEYEAVSAAMQLLRRSSKILKTLNLR